MKDKKIPQSSVQTVLSVSNTDIVTMLMVKQKELLQQKRPLLLANRKKIEEQYAKILFSKLEENLANNSSIERLKEALISLLEIYNPEAEFEVSLDDPLQIYAARRVSQYFNYRGSRPYGPPPETQKSFTVGKLPDLYITVPDKYEYAFEYPGGSKGFTIPEKDEVTEEKIIITDMDFKAICDINDEIAKIEAFLRDDKKLHEHIVAKMTERALSGNKELQNIVTDFILIE